MNARAAALAAACSLAIGCPAAVAAEKTEEKALVADDSLKRDLETLRAARVFFGHHSVGRDLLDGVAQLAKEAGVEVSLGEGPVGENQDPKSKFEAWAKKAESGVEADLMVMKLCFVDFTPHTNPEELLSAYQAAVARVKQAKPGVKIVHVTAPLTGRAGGAKAWLNRTVGRSVWADDANARRLAYNRALRAAFPGEPIFDLATVESTRPDGSREEHAVGGQPVPMLWPGYTYDDGHLNDAGKRVAARAFIATLAQALRR